MQKKLLVIPSLPTIIITAEQIRQHTYNFNSDQDSVAADFAIAELFALPITLQSHFNRVVLLDALFNTSLRRSKPRAGRERRSLVEISEAIRSQLPDLARLVESLRSNSLFELDLSHPDVSHTISDCMKALVQCLNNNSMSFAGKYLHFIFPSLFPPWDSLVLQAINTLSKQEIFPAKALKASELDTPEWYLRLCEIYQGIYARLLPEDRIAIVQHDFSTQPEEWRRTNTLVRIIDKSLWTKGKQARKQGGEQPAQATRNPRT